MRRPAPDHVLLHLPPGQANHPVCQLNWHHARAYCRWLSERTGRVVRLPHHAEWQRAAR